MRKLFTIGELTICLIKVGQDDVLLRIGDLPLWLVYDILDLLSYIGFKFHEFGEANLLFFFLELLEKLVDLRTR